MIEHVFTSHLLLYPRAELYQLLLVFNLGVWRSNIDWFFNFDNFSGHMVTLVHLDNFIDFLFLQGLFLSFLALLGDF